MPEIKANYHKHIENFTLLGSVLQNFLSGQLSATDANQQTLTAAIQSSCNDNGYFTQQSIHYALQSIAQMISLPGLQQFAAPYSWKKESAGQPKTIGVVMAGNIPLVGFHDFFCVLITGNRFLGKLSQQDRYLLPALAGILTDIDSSYASLISFTNDKIEGFDAVIATGSNNTARYFEYYFAKYPHIIRKSRNSIAILSGNETQQELGLLTDDIFQYFGLGCRNVSKLFVPTGYDFNKLAEASASFMHYSNHNHFRNNYDYYRTIFQMNNLAFIDCGYFLLQENKLLHPPVAVIYFEYYSGYDQIKEFIHKNHDHLQCVIGNNAEIAGLIPFGQAQSPQLKDFADNVDTIDFLLALR